MIVTESIGRTETCDDLDDFLRIDIYKPVIDKALSELNRRFSSDNLAVLQAVGALVRSSDNFLNSDVLAPIWPSITKSMKKIQISRSAK